MPETFTLDSIQKIYFTNLQDKGQRSPETWRDQILYFLLPNRFSDGKEEEERRPLFNPANPYEYKHPDKKDWMNAGKFFQGVKIKGINQKLDYLQQKIFLRFININAG